MMMMIRSFLPVFYVVLALVASLVQGRTLTAQDVESIKSLITTTFGLAPSYGTYCNAKLSPCPMGDNIGALVRLAFHDAAGTGGANGCIDFVHTSSNNGLQDVVATLDAMYYANNLDLIISKADLYVLAANTATEYATMEPATVRRSLVADASEDIESAPDSASSRATGPTRPPITARPSPSPVARPTQTPVASPTKTPTVYPSARPTANPTTSAPTFEPSGRPTKAPVAGTITTVTLDPVPYTLSLPFRYGRVDSATCDDSGSLPGADFKWSQIFGLFGGRMGMNIKEVVAILGAHSVGRCEFANSGVDGGWTISQSSFSNSYYKGFAGTAWHNNNNSDIWLNGNPRNVLLMADVELLFNTDSSGVMGTCSSFNSLRPSATCPLQGQSSSAFKAYANDISMFFGNYTTAWQKMTEYGFADVVVDVGVAPMSGSSTNNDDVYPQVLGTYSPTAIPTPKPTVSLRPTTPTSTTSNSRPRRPPLSAGVGVGFGVGVFVLGSGFFYYMKNSRVLPVNVKSEPEVELSSSSAASAPSATTGPEDIQLDLQTAAV